MTFPRKTGPVKSRDFATKKSRFAEIRVWYGYQRIHVLLRREGWHVNHKKVYLIYCIYCEERLNLRRKRLRRRVSAACREQRPEVYNIDQVWSMDFVADSFTFVADTGLGYFVVPWLQPVIEAAYSFEDPYGGEVLSVFSLTGGFTLPLADTLTVILGITGDVAEDNADRQLTLTAAFTSLF